MPSGGPSCRFGIGRCGCWSLWGGGQAKRVNIGIALVGSNPRVLYLDEPTSGLDSYTSNEVMSVVRTLLKDGMTIVATIHSPTPYCFNLFDRLMILIGGFVIYNGHNGLPAVHFFEDTNPDVPRFGSMESENDNPAEWIVDLTTQADRDGRKQEMLEKFEGSVLFETNTTMVDAEIINTDAADGEMIKELTTKRATSTTFLFALKTILKYRMSKDYRDVMFLYPRIVDKFLIAFIVMSLYWKAGKPLLINYPDSEIVQRTIQFQSAQNIGAMLFVWTILPAFAAMTYIPALVLERSIFYRERADGLFTPLCYLTARMIEELVIAFFNAVAFSALAFYPVFLSGSFVTFFLAKFITTSIGITLGYLVAAVSPSMEIANSLYPAYVVSLLFFVGLLIRMPDIPNYWKWNVYINPLHYAWVSMMVNQFGHSNLIVPYNGNILVFFGIGGQDKWANLGYEALFFVGFFTLAVLSLTFIKHQQR